MAGMSFDCQFFVEIRKHTEQRHWNVWNGEYCANSGIGLNHALLSPHIGPRPLLLKMQCGNSAKRSSSMRC